MAVARPLRARDGGLTLARRAPRPRRRRVGGERRAHERDGHGPGHRSRRPRLVRRHLGADDGGDDAARAPPRGAGRRRARRVRDGLPRRLDRRRRSRRTRWSRASGPSIPAGWPGTGGPLGRRPGRSWPRPPTRSRRRRAACLDRCRTAPGPEANPGRPGPARRGSATARPCVGCCAGLMAVLFVLGVMSLTWMVAVTALIAAERLLPWRTPAVYGVAAALAVLAVWIAVDPGEPPRPGAAGAPMGACRSSWVIRGDARSSAIVAAGSSKTSPHV